MLDSYINISSLIWRFLSLPKGEGKILSRYFTNVWLLCTLNSQCLKNLTWFLLLIIFTNRFYYYIIGNVQAVLTQMLCSWIWSVSVLQPQGRPSKSQLSCVSAKFTQRNPAGFDDFEDKVKLLLCVYLSAMTESRLEKVAVQKEAINAKRFADAGRSKRIKTYKYDPTKTRPVSSDKE